MPVSKFDPYSVPEGTEVDVSGIGELALGDIRRKLARRSLTIVDGVITRKPELEEFERHEKWVVERSLARSRR